MQTIFFKENVAANNFFRVQLLAWFVTSSFRSTPTCCSTNDSTPVRTFLWCCFCPSVSPCNYHRYKPLSYAQNPVYRSVQEVYEALLEDVYFSCLTHIIYFSQWIVFGEISMFCSLNEMKHSEMRQCELIHCCSLVVEHSLVLYKYYSILQHLGVSNSPDMYGNGTYFHVFHIPQCVYF